MSIKLPDVHAKRGMLGSTNPTSDIPHLQTQRVPATNSTGPSLEEAPPTPRRKNADSMPSFEIMEHLRRRNLVPSGFYEDDKKKLQDIFDADYEKQKIARQAYMAKVDASRKDNYTRLFAERKKRRDEMEILSALKNHPHVPMWLDLVRRGKCNSYATWNGIKKPLVRYIAVELPVSSNLTGLDFCRCKINDDVCGLLSTMLVANRSLRQLNLAENLIGSLGLAHVAKALEVNDVLKFIGLEGNRLQHGTDPNVVDNTGIDAFVNMIKVNNTLTRANLLGTGLDKSAFSLLEGALRQNESIMILDIDPSRAALDDARSIFQSLSRNQALEKKEKARQQKVKLEQKRQQRNEDEEEARALEQKREAEWAEEQRLHRIQERKRVKQEERKQKLLEEQRQREIAHAKLQLALAAASGKKKKKKGKGKKKKKKK